MGEMAFAKSLSGMSPEHKIIAREMATCEKLKETTSVDNVTKFRHKRLPRNVFCHCWEPCPRLKEGLEAYGMSVVWQKCQKYQALQLELVCGFSPSSPTSLNNAIMSIVQDFLVLPRREASRSLTRTPHRETVEHPHNDGAEPWRSARVGLRGRLANQLEYFNPTIFYRFMQNKCEHKNMVFFCEASRRRKGKISVLAFNLLSLSLAEISKHFDQRRTQCLLWKTREIAF